MIRNDVRESHEEIYKKTNELPLSVCKGEFYIENQKKTIKCAHCYECHKYKRYVSVREELPLVKFRHVESFRRCQLFKQIINKDLIRVISFMNTLYVNDLACSCILEMFDEIKEKDKETQKIYRALYKRMIAYQKEINSKVKKICPPDDFAEFTSMMDDNIQPILDSLYEAVTSELNNNNVNDAEFIAKAEVARTMVDYSIFSLKTRALECRRYDTECLLLYDLKLDDIKKVVTNLSDWCMRNIKGIDLSQERFTSIMKNLSKHLNDFKTLTEYIGKTIDKSLLEENGK